MFALQNKLLTYFRIFMSSKKYTLQGIVNALHDEGLSTIVGWNMCLFPTMAKCVKISLLNPYKLCASREVGTTIFCKT